MTTYNHLFDFAFSLEHDVFGRLEARKPLTNKGDDLTAQGAAT